MPVISDTEESEFDELEYESDSKYKAPKPKGKKVKKAKGSKVLYSIKLSVWNSTKLILFLY